MRMVRFKVLNYVVFLFAVAIRMAPVHQLSFAISTGVGGAYVATSLSTWNEFYYF